MRTQSLPISQLSPNPSNARAKREYTKTELKDLLASIRQHGLLQPLVVAPDGNAYTVLAGHRRLAALNALKAKEAPCVVLDTKDDKAALAVLLTENAQHRAVDPLREAKAVAKLVEDLTGEAHPHDRASTMLGKSVAWIRARLRLTTLSPSWRKAFTDPEHPISQFPVGHLELIAALSPSTQELAFEQWGGWWDEGVPLREDIRRMVAELTCDLGDVPWDLANEELVSDAPACSACPRRDSTQGDLFGGLGGVHKAKGDRCLDASCFEAKRRATIYRRIEEAQAKHGDKLRIELPWAYRDIPMPEGLTVHAAHELSPLTKAKGGLPFLRLPTSKITYMGTASRSVSAGHGAGAEPLGADGSPKPKSLEERREGLEKRRLVRALNLFQGTLMNRTVHVGTAKHPEEVVPPEPKPPSLDDLITYVLVYGTGPSVDPDGDNYDAYVAGNAKELESLAKETSSRARRSTLLTRARLWNRVREPIARSLRTYGGVSLTGAQRMADTAASVCRRSGMDWTTQFVAAAIEAIPEPASWAKLNEDGTPAHARRQRG